MYCLIAVLVTVAFANGGVPSTRRTTSLLDDKIVGGQTVTIEEYPYQVSFELFGSHLCGGSLVRPNIVITAAHCTAGFRNYIKSMSVRAGSTYKGSGGQVARVVGICDHPKFSPQNSYDYDVSLLRLSEPFTLGAEVQVVSLQPINQEVPVRTEATVTGWGVLSHQGTAAEVLQAVNVPKIDSSMCAGFYYGEHISSRMHCFGFEKGGKDACQGDSGGPLVVNGKLAGIVSWGYGCAYPRYPGVYTKVADPEINDHINTCIAMYT